MRAGLQSCVAESLRAPRENPVPERWARLLRLALAARARKGLLTSAMSARACVGEPDELQGWYARV